MSWRQRRLLKAGDRVPDFRLARLEGGEVGLGEIMANGPALLAFFKVTCPVCQFTFPLFNRIHIPGGLAVYGVSQNGAEETRSFNRDYAVSFPTLVDSEDAGFPVSNSFGISVVPTAFLIERDGTVSRVMEGWQKREVEGMGAKAGVQPFQAGEYVPEWKAG